MRNDFDYTVEQPRKKWLATLANNSTYKARRLQAICYLSLLVNIIFAVCFAVMIFGR